QPGKATIKIYDITGKAFETLLNGHQTAGRHHITFHGSHLSSGVYLYRLTTEQGHSKMRKMILIK
ncbi:MAG: T9SS type A sorting domain-containing protein, partial [Caldithrix sp.]|nr:T9SS type A sorting domain-containing protein [Caldithrix sp.]